MILLKTLKWSNAFSYGVDNVIDFTKNQLLQLVGKNGHGKSSIALILEEVLYNKNSKNIKKADILNRYTKDKFYTIELEFEKDGIEYKIETKRSSTQTVKLFKQGKDISSHTATTTYKIIEQLIGLDHKTFTQIVYQSHAGSLEFLTSADTARKKFLIELLNLTKYTKAGEIFKDLKDTLTKELNVVQGKVTTIKDWIDKYSNVDLTVKEIQPVLELDTDLVQKSNSLQLTLQDIEKTNKKINQNNQYKNLLNNINVIKPIPELPKESAETYIKEAAIAHQQEKTAKDFYNKLTKLTTGVCPTCLSNIDEVKTKELAENQQAIINISNEKYNIAIKKAEKIREQINNHQKAKKSVEDWEKYFNLIDSELPEVILSAEELTKELDSINSTIKSLKDRIAKIDKENKSSIAHNTKIELLKTQLVEMQEDLDVNLKTVDVLSNKLNILNILVKTFSTTGLVAYKIENLIKDLEELTNEYLAELSSGRFQISFQVNGSDKLNVIITDNGNNIDIQALSGGEKARVNVASLLAIRKLMQSLSHSRINLLILDETVEALDVDGKEKLIEVLLGEESLNTVLVSHGFTHPLLEKIHVTKIKNISRIED